MIKRFYKTKNGKIVDLNDYDVQFNKSPYLVYRPKGNACKTFIVHESEIVATADTIEGLVDNENKGLDSVKDLLHDMETDINWIKSYKDFKDDKPYLLGWISKIRILLGIKEELE